MDGSSFEETYAKYLELLGKLDEVEDISEKNGMFRELAKLLCEMENRIKSRIPLSDPEASAADTDLSYWI